MRTAAVRKNFISGARHCYGWGFVSFYTPSPQLETACCWACRAAAHQPHQALAALRPRTKGWSLQNERKETGQGVKPKKLAATVTSRHLSGAAGRGSFCEWDRDGQRFSNGREQRAGGVQEMPKRTACNKKKYYLHILCSYTLYKWMKGSLLQKRSEASSKRFKDHYVIQI